MIKWLERNFSSLRKPSLARKYANYREIVEWVGRISGEHYTQKGNSLEKGRHPFVR